MIKATHRNYIHFHGGQNTKKCIDLKLQSKSFKSFIQFHISYVNRMYSYVTRMTLVGHSYVLVYYMYVPACQLYLTYMY